MFLTKSTILVMLITLTTGLLQAQKLDKKKYQLRILLDSATKPSGDPSLVINKGFSNWNVIAFNG